MNLERVHALDRRLDPRLDITPAAIVRRDHHRHSFMVTLATTFLATIAGLNTPPAVAQDTSPMTASGPNTLQKQAEGAGLAGPQSAGGQLSGDKAERQRISRFSFLDATLEPIENAKARLKARTGLDIGFDYQALYQRASTSLTDNKDGAAGAARIFGTWTLVGRGTDSPGKLVFIVENRHRLGDGITPAELGFGVGYSGVTGVTFADPGSVLSVLYWQQEFRGHTGVALGRIDPADFTDILGYGNPRTTFSNFATLFNPTIPFPDPGMGGAIGSYFTKSFYGLGVVSDANGSLKDVDFFPEGAELFSYGQIGWTPSRKERFTSNIHVGGWHVDERKKAGVPESYGITLSANTTIGETLMPFARLGYSWGEAPLANTAATIGLMRYFPTYGDLFGAAINWAEPSTAGLPDQYTGEVFYRFQVSNHWAITGDLQVLWNPALNPSENRIAIFGLRSRFDL